MSAQPPSLPSSPAEADPPPSAESRTVALRVSLATGAAFFACALVLLLAVHRYERRQALEEADARATLVLSRNLATHAYFSQQLKPAIFPLLGEREKRGYFDPVWMSSASAPYWSAEDFPTATSPTPASW